MKRTVIMKKIAILLIIATICLTFAGCKSTPISNETPLNDPAISNKGKLALTETMILVIEDGFELDGTYDRRLCPNGQLAMARANRTILEIEQQNNVDIDYEFVDYEMGEYSKVDDYNYVAHFKLKGKNAAGEYSYVETDAYFFCIEANTYGGFDLQCHCDGLTEAIESLI